MISYSQNFEDVILWRALKDVTKGFYIDVGANDPTIDSVTRFFYDSGWRGINIEPVEQWFDKLEQHRPKDVNLKLAAGESKGEFELYEIPDTGLSTTNKEIAEQHQSQGEFDIVQCQVSVKTLTEICQQYHVSLIHFLKIDVEGAEEQVLNGLDLSCIRPWIIVVESTLPGTQQESYQQWQPKLLANDYEFVHFDGLNRYYLALEQSQLKPHFSVGPNVFDGFELSGTGSSSFHQQLAYLKAQQQQQTIAHQQALAYTNEQKNVLSHQLNDWNAVNKRQLLEIERGAKENNRITGELARLTVANTAYINLSERLEQLVIEKNEIAAQRDKVLVAVKAQNAQQSMLDMQLSRANDKNKKLAAAFDDSTKTNERLVNELVEGKAEISRMGDELQTLNKQVEVDKNTAHHWWSVATQNISENEQLNANLAATEVKVEELNLSSHQWWLNAQQSDARTRALEQSLSWRITLPLRWIFTLVIIVLRAIVWLPVYGVKTIFGYVMPSVLKNPVRAEKVNKLLMKWPWLHHHLVNLAKGKGIYPDRLSMPVARQTEDVNDSESMIMPPPSPSPSPLKSIAVVQDSVQCNSELAQLSPRARNIYRQLKTAVELKHKEQV